ncbi:MAG: TolC family protein [Bacteroidetes bacterium]|nr:TolC family protein [Bacteroidota bacterium]
MKKRKVIIPLLFAVFMANAQQELSLKQCIEYGVEHNMSIKKAKLEIEKNEEKRKEVLSTGLLQINATSSFNDNLVLPTQLLPGAIFGAPAGTFIPVRFGTQYNVNAGATASQLLYNQTLLVGVQASKVAEDLASLGAEKAKEQVIYDISTSYYALQVSNVQKQIIENNAKKVNQLLGVTKVQYENGFAKKTDYSRLLVNQTNLQTELDNLQLGMQYQEGLLKFFMGMPMDSTLVVAKLIEPSVLQSATNQPNISNNIDMRILETQKNLNQLNIKQYYAGYFPVLTATASYNWSNMGNEIHLTGANAKWYNTSAVGVNLTFPIFDGLNRHFKANQAKILQDQLDLDGLYLTESIRLQNLNAYNKLMSNHASVAVQEKNMKLAEEIYSSTQEQYNGGIVSMSELMNVETSLKEAQTNYLRALVQVKIAELELMKASGNIQSIIK